MYGGFRAVSQIFLDWIQWMGHTAMPNPSIHAPRFYANEIMQFIKRWEENSTCFRSCSAAQAISRQQVAKTNDANFDRELLLSKLLKRNRRRVTATGQWVDAKSVDYFVIIKRNLTLKLFKFPNKHEWFRYIWVCGEAAKLGRCCRWLNILCCANSHVNFTDELKHLRRNSNAIFRRSSS